MSKLRINWSVNSFWLFELISYSATWCNWGRSIKYNLVPSPDQHGLSGAVLMSTGNFSSSPSIGFSHDASIAASTINENVLNMCFTFTCLSILLQPSLTSPVRTNAVYLKLMNLSSIVTYNYSLYTISDIFWVYCLCQKLCYISWKMVIIHGNKILPKSSGWKRHARNGIQRTINLYRGSRKNAGYFSGMEILMTPLWVRINGTRPGL